MKKYDELSNKEKHNFEEFLILTFEFSDDELAVYILTRKNRLHGRSEPL